MSSSPSVSRYASLSEVSMSRVLRCLLTLGLLLCLSSTHAWAGTPGKPAFISPLTPPQIRVRVVAPEALSLTAPGATIDGATMASGDLVLRANPTPEATNGVYVWTGASSTMTRAPIADASDEWLPTMTFLVGDGTQYAGTLWAFKNTAIPTLGTTALTITQVREAQHNLTATTDPDAGECRVDGYTLGSLWRNTTPPETVSMCLMASTGEGTWVQLAGLASGSTATLQELFAAAGGELTTTCDDPLKLIGTLPGGQWWEFCVNDSGFAEFRLMPDGDFAYKLGASGEVVYVDQSDVVLWGVRENGELYGTATGV